MFKHALLLVVAIVMAGCAGWGSKGAVETENTEFWRTGFYKEKLSKTNFTLKIIRFTDARRVREKVSNKNQNVIYQYDPDALLSGVSFRLPVLFEKHMALTAESEPIYSVEMDLKNFKTAIYTGNIKHGPFGYYNVELEVDIIVRRPDSSLIMRDSFDVELDRSRKTYIGRDPSAELDKQRMFDLTEAAIRKIAQKVAWQMRGLHYNEIKRKKNSTVEKEDLLFAPLD